MSNTVNYYYYMPKILDFLFFCLYLQFINF